jgi:glyoxylase I family protein
MSAFPPIAHVALTVRDLEASVPWYTELFEAEPALDEDTGPFRHVVWMVSGTLWVPRILSRPLTGAFTAG